MIARGKLLTRRRLAYAWFAGAVLWLGWLGSVALGPGSFDLAGQVVGTDYLQFYAAGETLARGEGAELYDVAYQSRLQHEIAGPELAAFYAFITPPFLAWPFVWLSRLPYLASFVLWSGLGLLGLWGSLRLLGAESPLRSFAWSLTWFPVFAAVSFGQNSLLSLALLGLVFALWQRRRPAAAGAVASLLLYKPQLLLGLVLFWILEARRDWPALVTLALGGGTLAALCFGLEPEASAAYLEFARTVLPDLPAWQQFPIWHLHTVRGFWRLLLPESRALADGLSLAVALLGLLGFVRLWRHLRPDPPLQFAAAIGLTVLATPHAMIYDLAVLLIPAVLLWRHRPELRERWTTLFAAVWGVTFVSGQLTQLQLRVFPVAVQISVPVLLWALWAAGRELESARTQAGGERLGSRLEPAHS